jgi:hypothetical protein
MAEDPKKGGDARADLAEAVTLVTRAAGTALDRVGQVVGDALSGFVGGGATPALGTDVVPDVRPLFPVKAGEQVTARVRLENSADASSEPFDLAPTDLVSDEGETIPAGAVSVPDGQRVVAARASDTVQLSVNVPVDAKPGVYRGELRPTDGGVPAAPVVIHVR